MGEDRIAGGEPGKTARDGATPPPGPALPPGPPPAAGRSAALGRGPALVPASTYRLQLQPSFGFRAATEVVPYLHRLGISHLYSSPVFAARPGSTHGYDVVDPSRLNPELGTPQDFEDLVRSLHDRGMGLLLDIVPNHVAADPGNAWWMDVLERGRGSAYARFFDIAWHHGAGGADSGGGSPAVMLVPLLGASLEDCLARGEITIAAEDPDGPVAGPATDGSSAHPSASSPSRLALFARYYEKRFPLCVASWPLLAELGPPPQLADILAGRLDPDAAEARLAGLAAADPEAARFLAALPAAPAGLTRALLAAQHYRLAAADITASRLAYRRFFNVNELIGLRVEDEQVFEASHRFLFELVAAGLVDGVRVDHVDGLYDPAGYLERLHTRLCGAAGHAVYTVVEKILSDRETLPAWPVAGTTGYDFINDVEHLFVDREGLCRLDAAYRRFTGLDRDYADIAREGKRLVLTQLLGGELDDLVSRLDALAAPPTGPPPAAPVRASAAPPTASAPGAATRAGEGARDGWREALVEVTTALPVYRTYIRSLSVPERDRAIIAAAAASVRSRGGAPAGCLQVLEQLLTLEARSPIVARDPEAALDFVMRWQQLTGPVMAKGVEDTALYRYNRLLSLEEVGAQPQAFRDPVARFHERNARVARARPHGMNASSTHDSKRSEDVRARLDSLTELAGEWTAALALWSRLNASLKASHPAGPAPDADDEALIYQTLLGAWPFPPWPEVGASAAGAPVPGGAAPPRGMDGAAFEERLLAFCLKAAREAKRRTDWQQPDEPYEQALLEFARALLRGRSPAFTESFRALEARVAWSGMLNSLAALLLKTLAPGVPDFYQGTELWELLLVDPDNRSPVDFGTRAALLAGLPLDDAGDDASAGPAGRDLAERGSPGPGRAERGSLGPDSAERAGLLADLRDGWRDGRLKLFLTAVALRHRRDHPGRFGDSRSDSAHYLPLEMLGAHRQRVVAFARGSGDVWTLCVAPRLLGGLAQSSGQWPLGAAWGDTRLVLPGELPFQWTELLGRRSLQSKPAAARRPGGGAAGGTHEVARRTLLLADVFSELPLALLASSRA